MILSSVDEITAENKTCRHGELPAPAFAFRTLQNIFSIKHSVWGNVHFGHISLILTEAVQRELNDYLLLDLQGVHVVIALGCVLLGVGLGINEHIVFVP